MAIQQYLDEHEVFTSEQFTAAFPGSQTDRNLLTRAVAADKVTKVRRGLYVSKSGPFSRSKPDPLRVAEAAADDAVFAYLSALRIHGAAHNIARRVQFYTRSGISSFTYSGDEFVPYRMPANDPLDFGVEFTATGQGHMVTSREQTVVDCLGRLDRAGGVENVLRSLASLTFLDPERLSLLLVSQPGAVRSRVGWTLEAMQDNWGVPRHLLDDLAGSVESGLHRFTKRSGPGPDRFNNRWRLYLPESEAEMKSWMT